MICPECKVEVYCVDCGVHTESSVARATFRLMMHKTCKELELNNLLSYLPPSVESWWYAEKSLNGKG